MKQNLVAASVALAFLAACGGEAESGGEDALLTDTPQAVVADPSSPVAADAPAAEAQLADASGNPVGTATFTEMNGAVQIAVQVQGLPAGTHGIHIHETGTCTAPDFTSAGGHFNPAGTKHGLQNPQGAHGGDLENLEVGEDGTAIATLVNDRVVLGEGANSLFDADGSALVIHAGPDDQTTDPSGDSGARIACGVVTRR